MKIKRFRVEGAGDFPIDMLRYDACWPETQDDTRRVEKDEAPGRRAVHLETASDRSPTPARWEGFGWTVIA